MTVVVVQLGARMHYAVPAVFEKAGTLERFFTDICAVKGWPRLFWLVPSLLRPPSMRRLLARKPKGVPSGKITSFPTVGVHYQRRLRKCRDPKEEAEIHLSAGRELAERVIGQGLGAATVVYAFNSAAREIFRFARSKGVATVYEQTIAPVVVEWRLMRDEFERWRGWEDWSHVDDFYRAFAEIECEEWTLADRIVCGSDFVRDSIAASGGPADRCIIVPYGVDHAPAARREARGGKLRVLTVGTVSLRKGAPYVLEAAVRLYDAAEFRWVGPIKLTEHCSRKLSEHVHLTGGVPRSEMVDHYRWADVFLLLSMCEGSATASYEALVHGLPVVATPNTGAPVRDGLDGFLVPIRDASAAASALERFANEPELMGKMRQAIAERMAVLSVEDYGERLLAALRGVGGLP